MNARNQLGEEAGVPDAKPLSRNASYLADMRMHLPHSLAHNQVTVERLRRGFDLRRKKPTTKHTRRPHSALRNEKF